MTQTQDCLLNNAFIQAWQIEFRQRDLPAYRGGAWSTSLEEERAAVNPLTLSSELR
jgi:hypothetical protein